ncbi:hypothetical protein [Methylobacterium oryzae]|uniref:hypothetical protein n=1 Tax=Methylobacterium oryzae TaxID=334852 RepID=UPI002F359703
MPRVDARKIADAGEAIAHPSLRPMGAPPRARSRIMDFSRPDICKAEIETSLGEHMPFAQMALGIDELHRRDHEQTDAS